MPKDRAHPSSPPDSHAFRWRGPDDRLYYHAAPRRVIAFATRRSSATRPVRTSAPRGIAIATVADPLAAGCTTLAYLCNHTRLSRGPLDALVAHLRAPTTVKRAALRSTRYF
jgi:hypothetical protein